MLNRHSRCLILSAHKSGHNSEWLSKLNLAGAIKLAGNFTVQQFLVRDNFHQRIERGDPVWLHEFLRPAAGI